MFNSALASLRSTARKKVVKYESRFHAAEFTDNTGEHSKEVEKAFARLRDELGDETADSLYRSELHAAINALPPDLRRVIELTLEGVPDGPKGGDAITICNVVGRNEKTVYNRAKKGVGVAARRPESGGRRMSKSHDREAVLYAFAVEPIHDRGTLESYLRRYPDLADELVDLSSELRLDRATSSTPPGEVPDPGLDAAWQELLACETCTTSDAALVNPFAEFWGIAFVKLATALNVPRSFLTAFRDGLVTPSSIPESFTRRFAEATRVTVGSARGRSSATADGAGGSRVQVGRKAISPGPENLPGTR